MAAIDVRELAARTGQRLVVRRWAGAVVDIFVIAFVILVCNRLLAGSVASSWPLIAVALWIPIAYFVIFEAFWGSSVGKLVTKLRVVNGKGDLPSIGQVIVRTLLRLLEVNPLLIGAVPAGLAAYYSRHHQRLGDMLAGTYVVARADLDLARSAPAAE